MTRLERSVQVVNRKGLHARASAKLAGLAGGLPARITLSFEGETADARSIMDLLCLGAGIGATVSVQAEGEQAETALQAVEELFATGFGELGEDKARSDTEPPPSTAD